MLTLHISWLPNRSIFLLNLRLSRVVDTADCVKQITAHDSGNFSIPPLLTFTRAIYRLLKLPLPPSNPRGIPARGGTLLCEQMPSFRLSSKASAPFYSTSLLIVKQLRISNPVTTFCLNNYFYYLQVHIEGAVFSALLAFQAGWRRKRHFFFSLTQSPGSLSRQI